jgi:hypothetical protein
MVDRESLNWLSSLTSPGDIFFAVDGKGMFFPLALRPMDKTVGYDHTGETRPEDIQNAIATLQKYHVKFIQWPAQGCNPAFYNPDEDHPAPLSDYVQMNYHRAKRFGNPVDGHSAFVEIWQRND